MRLNRRVPVGTHGGVRGRLSYLFRGASYSIMQGKFAWRLEKKKEM